MQHVQARDVLFAERAVEQVEAQHTAVVGEQFELLVASLDLNRALGPGQVGVLHATVALQLVDTRQVLLGAAVRLDVHEGVQAGHAVTDPATGSGFRQAAEQYDVEYVGAHAGYHRDRAHRYFIDLAPGLVGCVAVVAAGHLERGNLVALLVMHAHAALR